MKECEIGFATTHCTHCKKAFPNIFTLTLQERMYTGETHLQSWEMTFEMKSVLQSHIAKSPFLISLLWLCMKECLPMKPYICTAVFVKWHLTWNKFCKHTLHTMQKGIFLYPYFGFAWKNVCRWNPISAVYVRWHLR